MWHIHTITQSAIEFLTSCFTSFHFLTPISGVLNLVYIITSSTNVRLLSPHGPPSFAENSTLSFREDDFNLLADAESPFKVPRPTCLPSTYNHVRKVHTKD